MTPSYFPSTADISTPLPLPAIRSQQMDDTTAAAVRQAEVDLSSVSLNVAPTIANRDVTLVINQLGVGVKATVDWGDGSSLESVTGAAVTGVGTSSTHTYARDGFYTVLVVSGQRRVNWEVKVGANPYKP